MDRFDLSFGATYSGGSFKATRVHCNTACLLRTAVSLLPKPVIFLQLLSTDGYSSRLNSEIFATLRKEYGKFRLTPYWVSHLKLTRRAQVSIF